MSSFTWKCVFYRPAHNVKGGNPMELNFEGLDMHKWNIPTGTAQRVDEKNRITFLVIMFTTGVMVIKISKKTHFLYFCWWQQKISHSLRLTEFFQKMVWLIDFGATVCYIWRVEISKKLLRQQKNIKILYF